MNEKYDVVYDNIIEIQNWIGYTDDIIHLTKDQAEKLLDWLEKNEFDGEINENWDKLDKFWDTLNLNLKDIKNIDYRDGLNLLWQLNNSKGSDWYQSSSCNEYNAHNLNCDYINDTYYTDKNNVFSETVSWVSYWNDVYGDEPVEVLKEKTHWEILRN